MKITSRERIDRALNHKTPDRVPLDFGAGPTTGIQASLVLSAQACTWACGASDSGDGIVSDAGRDR